MTSPSDNVKFASSRINSHNHVFWKHVNEFEVLECMGIVKDMNIAQLHGPKGKKNKIMVNILWFKIH